MASPPLWRHGPATLRVIWLLCACDPQSGLTCAQRETILTHLQSGGWVPPDAQAPAAAVVEAWYTTMEAIRKEHTR